MANNVDHPKHYNAFTAEAIDMMVSVYGKEKTADFCELNAFKYSIRAGLKEDNSVEQDIAKKLWYLNKANELRHI